MSVVSARRDIPGAGTMTSVRNLLIVKTTCRSIADDVSRLGALQKVARVAMV